MPSVNADSPRGVTRTAKPRRPQPLRVPRQKSCGRPTARGFTEMSPRREFATQESRLRLEKMRFCSSGSCAVPGSSGEPQPGSGGVDFSNQAAPGPGEGPPPARASLPARGTQDQTPLCPPAPGPGHRFLPASDDQASYFWGGKARFTPRPEPAWVSRVHACSPGPGLRDSASPSRPESKQS